MLTTLSSSRHRALLAGLLTLALIAAGCSSSGTNEEDNGNGNGNGNGTGGANTFTVTVAEKTSAHPFSGQGFNIGYVVDGEEGKELTLERGTTYEFQMDGVPSIHPFYITTSAVGQGESEYADGVDNNGASGSETLTFTPPSNVPDTLYYNCVNHAYMGGLITFTSGSSSGGGGTDY